MKRSLSAGLALAAFGLSTGVPPARADEAAPVEVVRLTLADAVARAQNASARLGQLRALEEAAAAGWRGARAQRLPNLGLSANYSRNSNVPEFVNQAPGQPPQVIFPNLPNQGYARASVSLPVYTGGRIGSTVAAAERQREAACLDATAGESDLVLETTSAYWSLVAQRQAEAVLREAIAAYEAHLADATHLFDNGMTARNELLAVQVERDRAELARLRAANAAELANANLARLLDLPPGAQLQAESELAAPEGATQDVEPLVKRALGVRPELAGLAARVAAAEAGVKTAHSGALPQLGVTGSYDYANPNSRIFPLAGTWRDTWSVAATVSILAFDGGRTSAATAEKRAQAEALRQQLVDAQRRVRLEVTSSLLEIRTAQAALSVAARNLEAARENVRVNKDRYEAGVSLSSELLDAESQLLRAGLDQTEATTQLLVARASLDRAVGR